VHTSSDGSGALPQILNRASLIPVNFAKSGDQIKHGRITVAPPDCHLLVTPYGVEMRHGPRENGFRPAIDPLFRTAARAFGPRVVGVVLSGALSDGAYGLSVIKQQGGAAIVQDPDDAVISSMPASALKAVDADAVLPAGRIAAEIERMAVDDSETGGPPMPSRDELEPQLKSGLTDVSEMRQRFGAASGLTCPDCGGALWEVIEGRLVRYQCHVGHQYATENLDVEQRNLVDGALWTAVRVLEEHAELKMRMATRAERGGMPTVAEGFAEGARDAREQARQIKSLLLATPAEKGPVTSGGGNGVPARHAKAVRMPEKPKKRVSSKSRRAQR